MKFQNLKIFRKYLEGSIKEKLQSKFLVINYDNYERTKFMDFILSYLPHENSFSISKFSAKDTTASQIQNYLNAPSLFGGSPIVVYDDIEVLKKADSKLIVEYLHDNNANSFLICGAKKKPSIFSDFEKYSAVLDLTFEKAFEKHKRYSDVIVEKCARAKKIVSPQAIEQLILQVGMDLSQIEQEVEKLITYIGDKQTIEIEDIKKIIISIKQHTLWQIAEEIIWGERKVSFDCMDITFFHGLVAALRFQLQMGLKLASIIEKGKKVDDFSSSFPRMNPKILNFRKEVAKIRGVKFFEKGLVSLFEIDLLSKSNFSMPNVLIDLFISKIKYLLTHYEKKANITS